MKSLILRRTHRFRKREEALLAFLIGGVGYGLIELLWRGHTHPTMLLVGGASFLGIFFCNRRLTRVPLLVRGMLCTFFVTVTELLSGILINRILHLGVWDYSSTRFHLLGQICLKYTFLWFLLCTALSFAVSRIFRGKRV